MKSKQEFINILLVSLDEKFSKKVALQLGDKLSMFFADCKDMIEYDLINPKEVLEKCGIEYFKKRERAVVKNCSEYYNNILSIDASLYIEYIDFFDKTFVIYLKLDKENVSKVVDKISFDKYDEFLKTNSEIVVELSNKKTADAVKKIINLMGEKL